MAGNQVTFVGVGTCNLTANQAGNANYNPATPVSVSIIIFSAPNASITVSPSSVFEDGATNLTYTVRLSQSVPIDTSVKLTTTGTATSGTDYTAAAATLLIAAGNTTGTVTIDPTADTLVEPNETVILTVVAGSGYTLGTPNSATGTIIDDDQQPTTTTIGSDLPDPSLTGQSYAVNVNVVGSGASPLGTVNVSDGAVSCTITLATGTAPNSAGGCNLTSTAAGAKTLTATYLPAGTAFGASSDTEAHQVNAAATSLILSEPARIRINTLTAIPFALSVTAPGAGTPNGTVTISAGATSICTATLPATSCSATFSSLGARSLSASFVPSNSDYLASSAAVSPNNVLVFALSDLSVSKSNGVRSYSVGDLLVYTIVLRNNGPDAAPNVRLVDMVPASLQKVRWTCTAALGAICPESGGVNSINAQLQTLPSGSSVTYILSGFVASPAPDSLSNTASALLPIDTSVEDPQLSNQSQTDTDVLDSVFSNGFEDPLVNGLNGSVTIDFMSVQHAVKETATLIRSFNDSNGEAVRIYARREQGQILLALALRLPDGTSTSWTLGAWQGISTDMRISWYAEADGEQGYRLRIAELSAR